MKELLEEMRNLRPPESPDETVLAVKTIGKSLKTACGQLGLPPLTHQDLRHYFATKAIQSGVDVPTVAKWLGHNDGGVLAMRTYGNVVDEHQRSQAKKVRF
jgi:integrase